MFFFNFYENDEQRLQASEAQGQQQVQQQQQAAAQQQRVATATVEPPETEQQRSPTAEDQWINQLTKGLEEDERFMEELEAFMETHGDWVNNHQENTVAEAGSVAGRYNRSNADEGYGVDGESAIGTRQHQRPRTESGA